MFWKYFLAWIPMIFLAIANGFLREQYKAWVGEWRAHQLSTLSLLLIDAVYIWLVVHFWTPASAAQALSLGLLWLLLTVLFEFLFGHYLMRASWIELLANYNLLAGRLWVLIPLWLAIAPWLYYQLQLKQAAL